LNTSNDDQQAHDQIAYDVSDQEPTDPTAGMGDHTAAATVATVAVVGVGALVFEAALIPGIALGVAAMLVPKFLPQIGSAIDPLVRGAYRAGRKTRDLLAGAEEHVHDLVDEVNAEGAEDPRKRARRDGPSI
jgi:hypothetical protein